VLGLLISVPITMFGSQLVLKLVDRFPHIITLGGAILAWTAVKMALGEPFMRTWMAGHASGWKLLAYAGAVGFIVLPVLWRNMRAGDKVLWLLMAFLLIWLAGFGALEAHLEMHDIFSPKWTILEEVVDLVMWVGWIPVAIPLQRALQRRWAA
ncbi:MAG: TerC family protein, partial [Rhodoferax sp.]